MTTQPHPEASLGVDRRPWTLAEDVKLLWRSWDEEVVVFNLASGQTHLLDALSAEVLRELERRATSVADLRAHFAGRFGVESEDLGDKLLEICRKFDQLGLVEQVDP